MTTSVEPDFLPEMTDLLRRTPEVLRALLAGLPQSWGESPDVEGGWRPRDVVGHLITAELDDWIVRTERILEHGTSVPFDSFNRFAFQGRDDAKSLDELVVWFADLRRESLARLSELVMDADLDLHGIHPALGEARCAS